MKPENSAFIRACPCAWPGNSVPRPLVIRGNSATYSKYSHAVTDIVREAVPVCEKTSIDEFYADLTGMDRFFGCWQYSSELRQKVMRETGLPISFGLSQNKTVSKVATGEAKPDNAIRIEHGTERPFLAPLGIRKIPMVGEKTYQTLRNLGRSPHRHPAGNASRHDGARARQTRPHHLAQSPR